MKTIRESLACLMPTRRWPAPRWWHPVLVVALGVAACAAGTPPANDNFAGATVITGATGSTNGDNTYATVEPCETAVVNVLEFPLPDPVTNSVWYVWTAPAGGAMQVTTYGSTANLDFVLSVWTSTNAAPSLCDGSLTNVVSDDGFPGFSTNSFSVVAGTKYYIEVSSYNDGSYAPGLTSFDQAGAYQLNWVETIPPVPTGAFKFTSATYVVSQSDSSAPLSADNNTVSGVSGARLTVTRPPPAYGRVLVDYAVSNLTYVNILMTNYYGTNVVTEFVSTDIPPIITFSNSYSTNIVSVNGSEQFVYGQGYFYTYVTNYFTNSATLTEGVAYAMTQPPVTSPLVVVATNMPMLANFVIYTNYNAGGFRVSIGEQVFGSLQNGRRTPGTRFEDGLNFTNSGVVYTNYAVYYTNTYITNIFGTNLSVQYASTAPYQPWYTTNFYYTNLAVGLIYATNSLYTNGALAPVSVLVTGTNWNVSPAADTTTVVELDFNTTNVVSLVTPISQSTPAPTNWPTVGFVGPIVTTTDPNGNQILSQTNDFAFQVTDYVTNQSAGPYGITLASGTLTFSNLQMSADIYVPVTPAALAGYGEVFLSNPRLDPQENPVVLQAPTIAGASAYLNALSPIFSSVVYPPRAGVFNFERSTFRTSRNVGTAIISVNRLGGLASDSASVDYIIDPNYPGYYAITPGNVDDSLGINNLYSPANTFPLQAGSDYATPNSDYTPITGTLSWGAYDFQPKQISIAITNNGLVEFNEDMLIQLHNALPLLPTPPVTFPLTDPGTIVGQVNQATLTIMFDADTVQGGQYPGQQPAGAVDRSWNRDNVSGSYPPNLNYPGTTPGNGGTVFAVAEEPDGTALFAGSFVSYDSTPYNRIVRVMANGFINPSPAFFQGNRSDLGNNSGANDAIYALALQPDGQIVIGGKFTAYNGSNRHYIARLNPDGSLDTTFAPGLGANGAVSAVTLQPNGQILIAGGFSSYNGVAVNQVARLNPDGSLDASFVGAPLGSGQVVVDAVAVDGAGRVLIGGNFTTVAGVNCGAVARLHADGSLDRTFTPGIGTYNSGTLITDPVQAIVAQADGTILIGGSFAYYNLVSKNGLARLYPDGTLDLTFASGTGTLNPITGDADTVNTIQLQPDGNILIGGNFMAYNQTRRIGLARVFQDGSLDTSFMDAAYNQFAGVPNFYFTQTAVAATYPQYNLPSQIYAIAIENNPFTTSSNILIGGSFEMVGGGSTRSDVRPRSNVARVIGGATPGPGNLEMMYNNYSVANSEGSLYVSLVRTNGNLGDISATFAATTAAPGPGVATAGTDFSPSLFDPTYVTAYAQGPNNAWDHIVGLYGPNYAEIPAVNPPSAAAAVLIDVFNSGNISGNLSANFALSAPAGVFALGGENIPNEAALGGNISAPFTIIDSNVKAGVLGFSIADYLVVQGNTATITLTRTNGSDNQVTVYYATSDGTAKNGVDYTGATNQLTFGIGVTNASFTIPTTLLSHLIQPDKTVNLTLFTPGGGATLGLSNATLIVVNGNYAQGHLAFSQTNYVVNENGQNAVVTVNRLGGSTGTLGVTFETANLTATNGVNYLGLTTNLVWNNGDATARTVTIPVLDDRVVTPNLVANLILTNSTVNGTNNPGPLDYGDAASPTNATLTIDNVDSAGSFQFSLSAYSVKKYAGYALVPVTRAGGTIGTVQVSYTTVDGTAVQGTDYTFVTNTLTFTNGEVSELITIPILDDGVTNNPSGPRQLLVQLSNPTGGASLSTPNPATLYIIDTESVNETPGTADSPFTFDFDNNVYALTLQANNQLLVGGDFTMADGVTRNHIARLNADGSLDANFSQPSDNYGAGDSVRAIAVQTDARILVGGAFTNFNGQTRGHIARLNADGTLDSLFNPGSGADNSVYAVAETLVNGNYQVLIAGAFASISGTTFNGIGQLNADGTPDSTFNPGGLGANNTVYAMAVQSDNKIIIGGDFTKYNGLANFNHLARLNPDGSADTNFNAVGSGPGDSVRAIAIQLDGKILIGGLFTNVNGQAFNHLARLNTDGTVDTSFAPGLGANDSVFALGLQSDTRIVVGGEFTAFSGVTRNRITRLNPDGSVDPSINFGTGANNFVTAVAVQLDTIVGYPTSVPDEKIIIGGGFTQYDGAPNPNIARIFGGSIGGSGSFQFSSANYQVDEVNTNVLITVWRTGGTTNAATGDITVTAFTSNGTAVAGTNYLAVTTNLDFPLGEVSRSFVIPVMDDGVVTPNLTVNLAITNPTVPATIGNQPTATLTIINDDSLVCFSNTTYSVPKNVVSGLAPITIVRLGGTNNTTTVNFTTTTGGTAVPATDYTPVTQTVTFNPGVSLVTVPIPINNNGIAEGNRTVTLQLAGAHGSTLINPTNATLTIIDTDNAPGELSFASPVYTVTEGGGVGYTSVSITIQRTFGSAGVVSVGFATADGTATAGAKYIPTNGVVTFGDGETSKTFPVAVLNTTTAEGPETFSLSLSNPTGNATLTSPASTVVTILNTNTGIAFASAANAFTEPSGPVNGTLLLNVFRYNNTNGTTTVNYSTTNGTAVANVDFVGLTNGTLTFNPGDSMKPILITTLHDTNVTGDLFFTVGLANPSGSAQLTTPSFTVVTDHDADAGINFYTNAASVYRNAGYVLIPVRCSNTNAEPVSVNFATGGGNAVAGTDYTAESGTLTFTNGVAFTYFVVPILLNNSVQSNRTFNVTLSSPTPPGVLIPPATETVTIIGTNTPAGLSFATPIVIGGSWGVTNVDNTLGAPETGDPTIANAGPNAPVWFVWTAPPGVNGEIELDTIGSVGTNGMKLDTVLGVYTGTSLSGLSQVAANDDLYPNYPTIQENLSIQNIWNTNLSVFSFTYTIFGITYTNYFTNNISEFFGNEYLVTQPFTGPSGLRFNATAGTTYFIAADTKVSLNTLYNTGLRNNNFNSSTPLRGVIQLNWAYHPAGVFRFASEEVDETGITDTNGNPMLLYHCSEAEGSASGANLLTGVGDLHRLVGPTTGHEYETTVSAYYTYDVQGLLVTVTRVAGSTGRVLVDYTTQDGNTNLITNGDVPALGNVPSSINYVPGFGYVTNYVAQDYVPVSGTLIFDDFEMSKTIRIPIIDDATQGGINRNGILNNGLGFGIPQPNRDFFVVLSNPRLDPAESTAVSAPRVDPIFGKVLCRILDCDIDPQGPTSLQLLTTNITLLSTNIFTNTIIADQFGQLIEPTNALFNLSKSHYRVPRDVQNYWSNGTPVTVYVNRNGTNTSSQTVHYRLDNYFLDNNSVDDPNNEFALQAGSDYATPTPPNINSILGTNSDFAGVGGDSGTLTFPGGKSNPYQSQPIHFNVSNNYITEFNKDLHITIYELDANGVPFQSGMVSEATVTILFDDTQPPAGSVDEFYNPDFASDLALLNIPRDFNGTVPNPGADREVYAVAWLTNNESIIGGAFNSYADSTNSAHLVHGLARLFANGQLDPGFNAGAGINVAAGSYIQSLAVTPDNKIVIGGNFTSYNNQSRNYIARVNLNGSLDTTFTNLSGFNGMVWCVQVQTDGKVLAGGNFTSYAGIPCNYIARLNTDGSLDTTFNSSNLITGPVKAIALAADQPFSFAHASSNGNTNQDVQVLNLGLQTTGTLNVYFNTPTGTNELQIYYGTTNVAAGTGVLLYDSGPGVGTVAGPLPFGPVGGFATNIITVVMNPGGQPMGYSAWNYALTMPGETSVMIGGQFTVAGQTYANIARLNGDGSLDTTFNAGTGPSGQVLALAWQEDHKIILGGSFASLSGVALNNLARLNADGSIDSSYNNGTGTDNSVNCLTLQPVLVNLYVGGPFTLMNGTHRLGFARLNSDGTVDTSFLDPAYNQYAGLPRILYADAPGAVYAAALQGDGNVLIGGSFQEVGGGQADVYVRAILEEQRGLFPSLDDTNLFVAFGGGNLEPKTRDGVRNRSNFARLIAGVTPGPGNIGMASGSYAANKTQLLEPVTLLRANGSLGYASANFTVQPGLAQSGVDYSYQGTAPLYPIAWEYLETDNLTRMHSHGFYGADGLMLDIFGDIFKPGVNGPASVNVYVLNNTAAAGNLSAEFKMANPSGADQFYLGGQNIPLGVALGQSQAPLTIVDDSHQDGVFGFASPSFAATNSPLTLTLSRTNGTYGKVQLSYQTVTNGSTAVANVDYRPTNGVVVTFESGYTAPDSPAQLTILNNSSISPVEKTVNVQLYKIQDFAGGNATLGLTNAVVRIINPNYPGYLSFNTNAYYANLSAGMINFTVSRTVGSKGTLTVQYVTADGTARNNINYLGATNTTLGAVNTLTWNNADVSPRTVSIPLLNASVIGPVKTFAATLVNATLNGTNAPGVLGAITNAVFAIVNDNSYGTFQFSSPSYQVNENGGYATISVTRSGSALGTASVNFATVDGTAFAGTNYVATNNTLSFLPGQLLQSFQVPILSNGRTNGLPAAGFYFGVALSSPSSGAYLGSPTNALVHLVNVQEYNQPPGSVDLSYTASVNASILGLALQSDGQVVAGGSFTVADGTSRTRLARFNTDGTLDTDFLNGMAGANNSVNAVVSQTDDHILVGGAFSSLDGVNSQRIARLMTDGSLDTSFNPGSGADNTVFALAEAFVNGGRVVYAGGAFGNFEGVSSPGLVRLTDSGAVDASFSVGEGVVGTVYALAVYPTNSVYNAGDILVGGTFTNFNGTIVGNLLRLHPDGSLDTSFTTNVVTDGAVRAIAIQLDGRVLIGGEFTNIFSGSIDNPANNLARLNADGTLDTAFATNAAPGINGTVIALALQADNRIVVAGQFTTANGVTRNDLTRLLPTGAVDPSINFGAGANGAVNALVLQPTDGNLVIGGDFTQFGGQACDHIARIFGGSETGSGAFQFTSASYQVDEASGFATITVQRTGGTSGTNADGAGSVSVLFTTTNGTAVPGVNYVYTTTNLAFPVGEVFQTIQVPVLDDLNTTSNLTVNLSLSNPTPGTGLGDQAAAILTIINDNEFVEFQSPTYQVAKNTVNGFANIQIVRLGSTSGSCSVNFATTTNGTAVIGTDYYPTNELITFIPGIGTNIVQIPIINNGLVEGNRTVTLTLTNALNTVLASPSNAVLTIQDTVQAPGNLYFTATNYYANSSDGVGYLSVGRTNGTSGSVSVTYTTVQGTAIPGLNYVATTNTLTFQDGDTNESCMIPLINNLVAEAPVSLTVFLSKPTGGAGLIAPTNATLVVANTNAVFAFTLATNIVAENQASASLVVERFNNTNIDSKVYYSTTNMTAFANTNFVGVTNGLLDFTPGESFRAIGITLFNRSNINNLIFGVNLSNPTNAQLVAPSNTVVILEPAAAGVSFTTNITSVFKNAGSIVIPVVCSNPNVEPVLSSNTLPLEVSYFTVDGSAKAGFSYNAVSGTLLFTNGLGTNYITVPILTNQLVSSNLTFSVVLTNVTAPGQIAPYGTETVVIDESNTGMSFSQANYNVFKNAGLATITVNRTGFTNTVASVDYFVTNGTALGGQNFYPTNGTLLFTNGVMSQTFTVTLIANTLIQPNLFALMELLNPTNASVVNPGAATLTILETGGSYIAPAGSLLLTNSSLADWNNNVIGSNDTVQVMFALRAAAGLSVTNLTATLLVTNGVLAPIPASQLYTNLQVYGHSVSMPFSFTAHGTNTFTISPMFQLTADGRSAGFATFVYTLGAWTTTFANTNAIIINDNAAASPYPSIINATNLGHTLIKATVTLTNLSHQNIADLDALVVSPGTSNTLVMAHAGGGTKATHITLTFDDGATNGLPQNGMIVTGTNKPTQYYPVNNFP